MKRLSLYFTGEQEVDVKEESLPFLSNHQVLVQSKLSAISPGTELLLYRNLFPEEMDLDESIDTLSGEFNYPLKYGYSTVGQIIAIGKDVDPWWNNQFVFAFHPHESHFLAKPGDLIPLPNDISIEDAVFLPNMETAVNLVMDGNPIIGETVVVFGQGIVGLLTSALLTQFPLGQLATFDYYPIRRKACKELGVNISLSPEEIQQMDKADNILQDGADLTFELSGNPHAINDAIAITRYNGRIVIGSWYGKKSAPLNLGGRFHRSRINLISSQVSTISPDLSGRWNKKRRFNLCLQMLRKIQPSRLITQQFPIQNAAQAYRLIDQQPEETIQVVLTY